ncbi:MAG: DUF2330 domain-containing protein [Flavobacteriales bacterium]|nr:DUF2330 domain-containing protein [Flavobacteriales bacterium]
MYRSKFWVYLFLLLIAGTSAVPASAFCGFYVAKADATLFNNKSEIILVRNGQNTTITMSNDFKGDVDEFAMVVPVPVVLRKDQIRIARADLFEKLDTYSSPRLVEYYDPMPCMPEYALEVCDAVALSSSRMNLSSMMVFDAATNYGVSIEAQYDVGEYDILILSATESDGLKRWLLNNGYKIPAKAEQVLEPYIKDQMKFFVVKVDTQLFASSGYQELSPIQISFESDRFMLPIRLGMANSQGTQDMIVYAFTQEGRIECANYRTVKIPTDRNIPTFVKPKFGQFYTDLFEKAYHREGENAVFLEYAWNISPTFGVKCDPCNGPAPIVQDMMNAGVDWVDARNGQPQVFFTRLHVRYSRDEFPQDLLFQVTPNKEHFQGRYIMTHAAQGDMSCDEGQAYLSDLEVRRKKEVDELYALTGWKKDNAVNYIHEFSNQKKGEVFPIAIPGNGGKPGGMLMILVLGMVLSIGWWWVNDRRLAI